METKRQSYCWWFDSHNSPKCSPWLQSTLAELDEKTKAMLKLIDEEADSFAQRAEMYYKKRPELISMVEDFYRAHRSLAERYDQLRIDPASARVRSSPLRHLFSHFPKGEFDNVLISVKSFDTESFTEESEIDDPEPEEENPFLGRATNDESTKMGEELERLRQENEIQRHQIEQKYKQNEEFVTQMRKLEEEIETVRIENAKLKDEFECLEVLKMNHEKQFEQKEEVNYELMKLQEEMVNENRFLSNAVVEKDEEKREVIRQLSIGMEMLREENRFLKKAIKKDVPRNGGGGMKFRFSKV